MLLKIPLQKVPSDKVSISFTWDDNSSRHTSIISPLFLESGFRCTFYIVPGEKEFDSLYASKYSGLSHKGFEIGSHSLTHQYMTTLSKQDAENEFSDSVQKILRITSLYPLTFAFPNHDYNDTLLNQSYQCHLETRNTLANAIRFSIKTDTPLNKLTQAIDEAILSSTNLVFSGHSVITEKEYINNKSGEGYQPMRDSILSDLLYYLKTVTDKANVITLSQSALREWVKKMARLMDQEFQISSEQLKSLEKFQITPENIVSKL